MMHKQISKTSQPVFFFFLSTHAGLQTAYEMIGLDLFKSVLFLWLRAMCAFKELRLLQSSLLKSFLLPWLLSQCDSNRRDGGENALRSDEFS